MDLHTRSSACRHPGTGWRSSLHGRSQRSRSRRLGRYSRQPCGDILGSRARSAGGGVVPRRFRVGGLQAVGCLRAISTGGPLSLGSRAMNVRAGTPQCREPRALVVEVPRPRMVDYRQPEACPRARPTENGQDTVSARVATCTEVTSATGPCESSSSEAPQADSDQCARARGVESLTQRSPDNWRNSCSTC